MSARSDTVRNRVGAAVMVLLGLTTVVVGVVTGDVAMAVAGAVFVVAVGLVLGPLLRWLRRGEGPHSTRGRADDDREAYVRLRHNGGNGFGH